TKSPQQRSNRLIIDRSKGRVAGAKKETVALPAPVEMMAVAAAESKAEGQTDARIAVKAAVIRSTVGPIIAAVITVELAVIGGCRIWNDIDRRGRNVSWCRLNVSRGGGGGVWRCGRLSGRRWRSLGRDFC